MLAGLRRAEQAITTEPLRDGATRAARRAAEAQRRAGRTSPIRVRTAGDQVQVSGDRTVLGLFRRAMKLEQSSIDADYTKRIREAMEQ
jgi:hypothetical protein